MLLALLRTPALPYMREWEILVHKTYTPETDQHEISYSKIAGDDWRLAGELQVNKIRFRSAEDIDKPFDWGAWQSNDDDDEDEE